MRWDYAARFSSLFEVNQVDVVHIEGDMSLCAPTGVRFLPGQQVRVQIDKFEIPPIHGHSGWDDKRNKQEVGVNPFRYKVRIDLSMFHQG